MWQYLHKKDGAWKFVTSLAKMNGLFGILPPFPDKPAFSHAQDNNHRQQNPAIIMAIY